jgi:glycosyltransferase involved in cell wall biosynthesis
MTIHQLLPAFVPGDAISNQARLIRAVLRARDAAARPASQVYALYRDASAPDGGEPYGRLRLGRGDYLIYHHSIGSPVANVALQHLDRLILYYHNVTPAHFLRSYDGRGADMLDQGRAQLAQFKGAPVVLAASEYDCAELRALGFRGPAVIPLYVDADGLRASAGSPAGRGIVERYASGGWVNWLFVGRIVPNKRQDALIRAFRYYQRLVQPRARLLLVGSDRFTPGYRLELESLVRGAGLQDHVVFAGAPSLAEGFGGYYAAASVFVCASEHEGFCVPIVEAMAFGLPVVAFGTTGVPCAVGDAGLLVTDNTPATLAEAVNLALSDDGVRHRLEIRQPARLQAHGRAQVEAALGRLLPAYTHT